MRSDDELVATLFVTIAAVVLHQLADDRTLGMPDRKTATQLGRETQKIEFGREFAVIAFGRLFKPLQICLEIFLRGPGGSVNSLKHRVSFIATPISASNSHEFEMSKTTGVGDVWPTTQINKPRRVLVGAYKTGLGCRRGIVGCATNDFALVLVSAEQFERGVFRDLVANERLLFLDDLAHPSVEAIEIVGRERSAIGKFEVVIKAVFDRRADCEGGTRKEIEHGLSEHMGR